MAPRTLHRDVFVRDLSQWKIRKGLNLSLDQHSATFAPQGINAQMDWRKSAPCGAVKRNVHAIAARNFLYSLERILFFNIDHVICPQPEGNIETDVVF